MTQQSSPLNSDLINKLSTMFYNNNKEEKYYFDDFENDKRKNRMFTQKQKELCWKNCRVVTNRDPDRWRYDAASNLVIKALKGCMGPFCHEYDHILPYSKGGQTIIRNCQVLQTYVNRYKSNKIELSLEQMMKNSLKIDITEEEMDLLEKSIYGDVSRDATNFDKY